MIMRRIDLSTISDRDRTALLRRSAVPSAEIRTAAAAIVEGVRIGGDAAVAEYSDRFGGGRRGPVRVDPAEVEAARIAASPELIAAIEHAAANIRRYHEALRPEDQIVEVEPGVVVERRWTPLRRVGAYVPGGAAAYPSSLLMTVIPARVAGVESIAVTSPAASDGTVSPALLAAAAVAGVDELYVIGGAQAIAALAYGTETIRSVQKIVGPGNAWVTAAKLAVFGDCAIDLPAGPSEVVVVADDTADPRLVAADLLSQAEHGPDSPAVLVTTSSSLIEAVAAAIEELLQRLERRSVIETALRDHGLLVLAPNHDSAVEFAQDYGAEHVSIATADPDTDAKRLTAAGSVYVGEWAPEPVGDYASGANHVLPTGGLASAVGPLDLEMFGSWRQVQKLTEAGLRRLRDTVTELATAEGLTAHRLAVEIRFEDTP